MNIKQIDNFVCKMCLNPAYKNGLCVEHNQEYDYNDQPEGFIIRGSEEVFRNVNAFRVFNIGGWEGEKEIRLPGHIFLDYPKMKRLLNVHFKTCTLSYVKIIHEYEIYRFDDFVRAITFYFLFDGEVKRYYKNGEIVGLLVEITDSKYMNMKQWKDRVEDKIHYVYTQIRRILRAYDNDVEEGLIC